MTRFSLRACSFLPVAFALLPACLPDGETSCGTWHWDADGDGYDAEYVTCQPPAEAIAGTISAVTDCDDGDPALHPGQTDGGSLCDGLDDDCDGEIDEDRSEGGWWPDADNDGYGDANGTETGACEAGFGYVENPDDCDDTDPAVPAFDAPDACGDDVDGDCDGAIDDCALSGEVDIETLVARGDAERWSGQQVVALGDVNGDGADDLALGDPDADQVTLVFGGADARRTLTLSGDVGGGFGAALAAGDFDGDGDVDLAVGSPDAESGAGEVVLYAGPDFTGVTVLAAARGDERIGANLASLPGTTGDGLAVSVDTTYAVGGGDVARVVLMSAPWTETRVRGVEIGSYEAGYCGLRLFADPAGQHLVVGVPLHIDVPWVGFELYALPAAAGAEPTAAVGERLDESPHALGDAVALVTQADGTALALAGDYVEDTAYAWSMPATGALGSGDAALQWTGPQDSQFGVSLGLVGDLDGTGTDDLVFGGEGRIWIVNQGEGGLVGGDMETLAAAVVSGFDERVWAVTGVGDLDGDGYDELAVVNEDGVWVLYGGPAAS